LDQSSGRLVFSDKSQLEAENFLLGLADGLGKLTLPASLSKGHALNSSLLKGHFQNGCFQGLVKGFEYMPEDGIENNPGFEEPKLNFLGIYKSGYPIGPVWKILYSPDGIILGYYYIEKPAMPAKPNQMVDFTQKNVIFLYPDLLHGIIGQFDKRGVLITGSKGIVVSESSNSPHGIKQIQFEIDDEKRLKSDIANKNHLSKFPMVRDPYEETVVDVKKSNIEKAGDGVVLKKNTPVNTTVAYFNGIRLKKSDVFSWNPFKKTSVYLVETSDEKGNDIFIDIPAKYASWQRYQASAGHKVNHSKTPNVAYTECVHPIFGKILCLYTLKDLPEGSEVLTQYEIALDKDGMKSMLKAALEIGHRYTGKSRKQFANDVRPYLQLASNFADKIDPDFLMSF